MIFNLRKLNIVKAKSFGARLNSRTAIKLILWLCLSLALSLTFFPEFWVSLPAMLSPAWILGQHHAAPWGILALCLVFLWLKRKEIWKQMNQNAK